MNGLNAATGMASEATRLIKRRMATSPGHWLEAALILLIAAIGPAFYLRGLGFYTDDWPFLVLPRMNPGQSIGEIYASLAGNPNVAVRPFQTILYIFYYKVFAQEPFLIHAFNQFMFMTAMLIAFYGIKKIKILERDAYVVIITYTSLASYTTARLWMENHQSALSWLFFSIELILIIKIYNNKKNLVVILLMIFLVACACLLSYELMAFELLALPLFLAWGRGQSMCQIVRDRRFWLGSGAVFLAFVVTLVFKMHVGNSLAGHKTIPEYISAIVSLYARVGKTNFWTLGVAVPRTVAGIVAGPYFLPAAAAAALIAVLIIGFGELGRRSYQTRQILHQSHSVQIILVGFAAFILGYVPFFFNFNYDKSPFGIDNRCNIAGAIGVSFIVAGLLHEIRRVSGVLSSVLMIGFCAIGIFLQVQIGQLWGHAWTVQQKLYADLVAAKPDMHENEVLLLYGSCPYYGPVPVFSEGWGLAERLQLDTGIPTIQANTINRFSSAQPEGLHLTDDGSEVILPYKGVKIFDARNQRLALIDDFSDAKAYFANHPINQAITCDYEDYSGVSLSRSPR